MPHRKGKSYSMEDYEMSICDEIEDLEREMEMGRHLIPIILPQHLMAMLEIHSYFNPKSYPC